MPVPRLRASVATERRSFLLHHDLLRAWEQGGLPTASSRLQTSSASY
jgi:hypothetical protein